jgi:hypothetical protein
MRSRYIPQVTEAAIPEDGGWTELRADGTDTLVLSIPEWAGDVKQSEEADEYVWMYDRGNDAYLFCFRLKGKREYAVAFPREHAGILLKDKRAYAPFHLLITSQPLSDSDSLDPCFLFRNIELKRHPQAGW